MKTRIKVIIILSLTTTIILFSPLIHNLFVMQNLVILGIEHFSIADSSISLCKYLTVREEKDDDETFIKKYSYETGYYRYEYNNDLYCNYDKAILSMSYSEDIFPIVYADIVNQPGFSNDIIFEYSGYTFHLNDADRQCGGHFTDYRLDSDNPYLFWIELVGYSSQKKQFVFIGFSYCWAELKVFIWDLWIKRSSSYHFKGWNAFLDKEYSFFEWNK